MFSFIFIGIIIKMNHFLCSNNSVLHNFPALITQGYDVILSNVCSLLPSSLLSAILLISSVYTLCASLLDHCCDFNVISLFNK